MHAYATHCRKLIGDIPFSTNKKMKKKKKNLLMTLDSISNQLVVVLTWCSFPNTGAVNETIVNIFLIECSNIHRGCCILLSSKLYRHYNNYGIHTEKTAVSFCHWKQILVQRSPQNKILLLNKIQLYNFLS